MSNRSIDVFSSVFTMGGLDMTPEGVYVTVTLGILIYMFSIVCNLFLLILIATNRSLHEPMYVFLFNLSVNDLLGISAMLPRVISDLVSEKREVAFPACVIQAVCLHVYAGTTLLILSAMSFDRYIAICHPLRYHAIMTRGTVTKLTVSAWLFDILLISVLFGLLLRFPFCRTAVANFYCDNASLLRLVCPADTTLNNIYGLVITGILHGIAIFSVVFSYTWILLTCFKNKDSDSKLKALHTCSTHLLVFLIYEFSAFVIVLVYRIPNSPPILQKLMGMSFVIFPPSLNPIIYGIKTKGIRSKLTHALSNRIFTFSESGYNSKINKVQTIT